MPDTKLSALTALAVAPATTDEVYIRDVSEVGAAQSKRITVANLFTSPTFVTPALGTPASGVLTNVTGLPTAGMVDAAVTLAKMADIATARFIGRTTAATGVPEALTAAQATALLDAATATVKGLVPTPPNNTTTFLRGDATFATPASSAVTRVGGNTTEATTTSTTAVDLISVAALSITATTPWHYRNLSRKTGGAAAGGGLGMTLNTTALSVPSTVSSSPDNVCGSFSTTDRAESGQAVGEVQASVTSYTFGGIISRSPHWISGGANASSVTTRSEQADRPTATITDVIIRAISGNAAVTIGADEFHIYTLATS